MNLVLKNISLPLAHFTLEVEAEIRNQVAAIFGPLVYGIISKQTDNPRIAILSLEVFFIVGLIVMLTIPRSRP